MGKMKTHKASAKRFSFTATGKLKRGHMSTRHNTGLKTSKRKRHLRSGGYLSASMAPAVKQLIQKF